MMNDCRKCRFSDEIIGDYHLQCTNPKVRGAGAMANRSISKPLAVPLFAARDETSPCGVEGELFKQLRGILAKRKRARVLESEQSFWGRVQSRHGGRFGNPLGR